MAGALGNVTYRIYHVTYGCGREDFVPTHAAALHVAVMSEE